MELRKYISRSWKGLVMLSLVTLMALHGWAQSAEVPIDVQVPLFLKATTFDRTFPTKLQKNGVLQVGIFYQEKNRNSTLEAETLQAELSKPVSGFKIKITMIPIGEDEDFGKRPEWPGLTAIYITSMRGLDLASLLAQARQHKVLTVSTDPNLAAKGATMSFELVGSRPKFVINRQSASLEGCEFSSQLLKLATIY